jgi:hypothetical protein
MLSSVLHNTCARSSCGCPMVSSFPIVLEEDLIIGLELVKPVEDKASLGSRPAHAMAQKIDASCDRFLDLTLAENDITT